ncbi:MAG: hypothetical protein QM820_15480 [Minicystis sp.]
MGVEYTHYLLPTRPLQRPSAERVLAFMQALRGDGWIAAGPRGQREPCEYASGVDSGRLPAKVSVNWLRQRRAKLRIRWSLNEASRYPLTRRPYLRKGMYWDLELHWTRYYLPTPVQDLGRVVSIKTDCGDHLARRASVFRGAPFTTWLLTKCPSCGGLVDPEQAPGRFENPWTGASRQVAGMGLHRFAIKIDCGKCVPETTDGRPVLVHPDLVHLAERHFACAFQDDIGGFG